MVKSRSRMSARNSSSINEDKLFQEIEESKWNEMLQEEENDMFILKIRNEIVEKCLDACYENYMWRQAVAFTVHCSYFAWIKAINMYYMPRDQGDFDDPEIKESWEPDEEPEPSTIDSWATQYMGELTNVSLPEESVPQDVESETQETTQTDTTKSTILANRSYGGDLDGGEQDFLGEFPGESSELLLPRKRSIFTRTLSMPRDLLPLFEPLNAAFAQCGEEPQAVRKKPTTETKHPTFIDVTTVEPNRINVDFSVIAEGHVSGKHSPKKKKKKSFGKARKSS